MKDKQEGMSVYDFLRTYIEGLPAEVRNHPEYPFILNAGKSDAEVRDLEMEVGVIVPDELRQFYGFSYGAKLSDYEILTVPRLVEQIGWLSSEKAFWRDTIFPFGRVIDVGDYVAFDLSKRNDDGLLILDGFHEFPPLEWKGICFSLRTWLTRMIANDFHPFWLSSQVSDADGQGPD